VYNLLRVVQCQYRMSADEHHHHQQQQQQPDDVIYYNVDVDGVTESMRVLENLTDWQLNAITGLEHAGQQCLIQSWLNSPYNG